jgi:hypothetical protein|tara:strand:- start:13395 stop:13628 length:234 start_codon:yes stop_codon:yes gene_type:complete
VSVGDDLADEDPVRIDTATHVHTLVLRSSSPEDREKAWESLMLVLRRKLPPEYMVKTPEDRDRLESFLRRKLQEATA